MKKLFNLFIISMAVVSCGMSGKEMETAKGHFKNAAEQKCKCDKIRETSGSQSGDFAICVNEYERRVRRINDFFEVVKPTDSQRKEASKAGEEVAKNCN